MATIKVFSALGVKELQCFDTLDNVDFLTDQDDEVIEDDGELTVCAPLRDEESIERTRQNFKAQFPDY